MQKRLVTTESKQAHLMCPRAFECSLNEMQLEQLKHRLLQCMSEKEDSLRIYRMTQSRERYLWTFGLQHDIDYDAPLIF